MWVKKNMSHPPVITIRIGGMFMYVYHSQSWVIYDIVLPTLDHISTISPSGQVVIDGDRQVTLDPDNQNELRGASFARIPPGESASVASFFGGQPACGSIFLCFP